MRAASTTMELAEALLSTVAVAATSEKLGFEGCSRVSHRMRASDSSDATVDEAAMSARRRRRRFPQLLPWWWWWCFQEEDDLEQSLGDSSGSSVIRDIPSLPAG